MVDKVLLLLVKVEVILHLDMHLLLVSRLDTTMLQLDMKQEQILLRVMIIFTLDIEQDINKQVVQTLQLENKQDMLGVLLQVILQ